MSGKYVTVPRKVRRFSLRQRLEYFKGDNYDRWKKNIQGNSLLSNTLRKVWKSAKGDGTMAMFEEFLQYKSESISLDDYSDLEEVYLEQLKSHEDFISRLQDEQVALYHELSVLIDNEKELEKENKRLEQENKRLKRLKDENKRLKDENERLKDENERLEGEKVNKVVKQKRWWCWWSGSVLTEEKENEGVLQIV